MILSFMLLWLVASDEFKITDIQRKFHCMSHENVTQKAKPVQSFTKQLDFTFSALCSVFKCNFASAWVNQLLWSWLKKMPPIQLLIKSAIFFAVCHKFV